MDIKECLQWASVDMNVKHLDAQLLIMYILGKEKTYLYSHSDEEISEKNLVEYKRLISERLSGKPIQYIIKLQEFMGFDFYIDNRVLIPRSDTEILVESILKEIKGTETILEVGVGSGAVAISLDLLLSKSEIVGVDVSREALEVAKINNKRLNSNVELLLGNLFEPVIGRVFDIIISNPPYIGNDEYRVLDKNVKDYEPSLALIAENEGLWFYEQITKKSFEFLSSSGILAFEVGYNQSGRVKKIMEEKGYINIKVVQDLAGINRVVLGYRGEKNV